MKSNENVGQFFSRRGDVIPDVTQFNVFRIEDYRTASNYPHTRRDFYKIMLLTKADGFLVYADRRIKVNDLALVFGNPMVPYSWEGNSDGVTGYFCLFTERFIDRNLKGGSLSNSIMFRPGGSPVLYPDAESSILIEAVFRQMLNEMDKDYVNKLELLSSYVQVVIHESLKITPSIPEQKSGTSFERINTLFFKLLERQFPITSPGHIMQLKNANEFAFHLSVHTNHLNKALREVTGKATSIHISERVMMEAKALLQHSDWSVAEIGYCLGFEHPSNFNIYFKKHTGYTPNHFRKKIVSFS